MTQSLKIKSVAGNYGYHFFHTNWSPMEKEEFFFFHFTNMVSFEALYLKSILHILGTGPNLEAKCLLAGFTLLWFLKAVHTKFTYSTTDTH